MMTKVKVHRPKNKNTLLPPRYPRRVQFLIVTVVAVLVVLALVAVQLGVKKDPSKKGGGDTTADKPPESGDWIITKDISLDKGDYEVKGNVTIRSPGRLTLRNVTFLVSCSSPQTIVVEQGGELHVHSSTIDFASTPKSCELLAKAGSVLDIKDSKTKLALNIETNGTVIENNVFSGEFTGITLRSNSNKLTRNSITGANGPALQNAIYISNATKNTVSDNRMSGFSTAITLLGSTKTTIRNNTIASEPSTGQSTAAGIQFYGSSDNEISFNEINRCEIGVNLLDNSTGNTFHHNNFLGNTRQAADTSVNNFDDGSEGNYWSNYIGFDLNKDGKGDLPYVVTLVDYDNHPFMKPVKRP